MLHQVLFSGSMGRKGLRIDVRMRDTFTGRELWIDATCVHVRVPLAAHIRACERQPGSPEPDHPPTWQIFWTKPNTSMPCTRHCSQSLSSSSWTAIKCQEAPIFLAAPATTRYAVPIWSRPWRPIVSPRPTESVSTARGTRPRQEPCRSRQVLNSARASDWRTSAPSPTDTQ